MVGYKEGYNILFPLNIFSPLPSLFCSIQFIILCFTDTCLKFHSKLEGVASYAGQLLVPAEGFRPLTQVFLFGPQGIKSPCYAI